MVENIRWTKQDHLVVENEHAQPMVVPTTNNTRHEFQRQIFNKQKLVSQMFSIAFDTRLRMTEDNNTKTIPCFVIENEQKGCLLMICGAHCPKSSAATLIHACWHTIHLG